nr:unnamed protein product [Digitaria exilis]
MLSLHRSRGSPVPQLLVFSLLLVVVSPAVASNGNVASKPIVTPISKNASLYAIPIKNGAPLVLDLAGPLVWSKCSPPQGTSPPCNKSTACAVTVDVETLSANATDGKTPLYPVSFPANVACAPNRRRWRRGAD